MYYGTDQCPFVVGRSMSQQSGIRHIREFTDTICAWADKGHLYQKGNTHRDEYWICAHESYVTLFIYAPTVHSMIRRWKYSFQEGKQKVFMKHI